MSSDIIECFLKVLLGPVRILIQVCHGPKKKRNRRKSVNSEAELWKVVKGFVKWLDLHHKAHVCVVPSTSLIRTALIPDASKYPMKEMRKKITAVKWKPFLDTGQKYYEQWRLLILQKTTRYLTRLQLMPHHSDSLDHFSTTCIENSYENFAKVGLTMLCQINQWCMRHSPRHSVPAHSEGERTWLSELLFHHPLSWLPPKVPVQSQNTCI